MVEQGSASRRYGCPNCGGGLRYDIASRGMICDQCSSLTNLASLPEEQVEDTFSVTEFHCPQCGAAVYSTDTEVTSFCSFCGSDVVLTGKLGRAKRPARIVPFTVTREKCEEAYRGHLKKYLLVPGDLKKAETISHFRPVYVPFWSYSVAADGPACLEGKKSYTQGNYRYDETYDLSMDASIRQQGILYDASTAFEDETAAMLQHTSQDAVPFHPAYLSGFYAQGADVPGETYHGEAAASAARLFMNQVKEESGMDSVEIKGEIADNFGLPNARFEEELVMMPVWLLAHRQGQRVVYTAVNGQNGQVVCDIPVSSGKVAGVTLALAAGLFFLLQSFLTLKPDLLMAFCALISLATQYQFSHALKLLFLRKTRAGEPDFSSERPSFVGPAQSLLRGRNGRISAGKKGGEARSWVVPILILVAFLAYQFLPEMLSSGFTSAQRKNAALLVLLAVLVVMVIHTFRHFRKRDAGPLWPRLLSCLACAAAFISLGSGQVEDMIYYICAAAMLLSSMVELVWVNRSHNEYASRPVPFFGEKEDAR